MGLNIRTARSAKHLTQTDLAIEVGVNSGQVVSDWERGVASPSSENMAAVAVALGRDIGWFYVAEAAKAAA